MSFLYSLASFREVGENIGSFLYCVCVVVVPYMYCMTEFLEMVRIIFAAFSRLSLLLYRKTLSSTLKDLSKWKF
jgi:hypothetical protein